MAVPAVAYTVTRRCWMKPQKLLPRSCQVVFLADRGFADTQLMGHLKRLGWHFRFASSRIFWWTVRGVLPCKLAVSA